MLIGLDIGNSRTKIAVFSKDSILPEKKFVFQSSRNISFIESMKRIGDSVSESGHTSAEISRVCICSVVPELSAIYSDACHRIFNIKPQLVSPAVSLSYRINYDISNIGADRIADCEAAIRIHKGNSIVVNCGTAITFSIMLEEAVFEGGMITSGIFTSMEALTEKGAMLKSVEVERPQSLVGRNTDGAVKSGLFFGAASTIEGICRRIKSSYSRDFTAILTGGYSEMLFEEVDFEKKLDTDLTMKGIKFVSDLN